MYLRLMERCQGIMYEESWYYVLRVMVLCIRCTVLCIRVSAVQNKRIRIRPSHTPYLSCSYSLYSCFFLADK